MLPGNVLCSELRNLTYREAAAIRTYRDYVNDTGQDVAVEAGPNGPENVNHYFSVVTLINRHTES